MKSADKALLKRVEAQLEGLNCTDDLRYLVATEAVSQELGIRELTQCCSV